METAKEYFKNLSEKDRLNVGVIVTYDRIVSSFVICEYIISFSKNSKLLSQSDLFVSIKDTFFQDIYNGFGKLFGYSNDKKTCSINSLDLNGNELLEKERNILKDRYIHKYKKVRDKLTAHLDMHSLNNYETNYVNFLELQNYLESIKIFIRKVIPYSERRYYLEVFDIDIIRKRYNQQIRALLYDFFKNRTDI